MVTIKKYANRRLYDTGDSRYITLDELAEKIRGGADVKVVDAATHEDLTQQTLVQIIVEGRGAARMLPVPLLTQLIRMNDENLAEFLGRYVAWSLEMYLHAKQQAQNLAPYNPFATLPFAAGDAMARMFARAHDAGPFGWGFASQTPPPPAPPPPGEDPLAELRKELDELKQELKRKKR